MIYLACLVFKMISYQHIKRRRFQAQKSGLSWEKKSNLVTLGGGFSIQSSGAAGPVVLRLLPTHLAHSVWALFSLSELLES